MPTYDYRCSECGHTFEEFQSMSAESLITCPNCKRPALKRLMGGGAGMIFKGSGFYLTDYKSSSASGESKSDPKTETKKEVKKEAAPESKPATPPPAADAKS